ncbi:hypothetical protein HPB50_017533 [Hyalomma asiaticum]|uniref:Uncharacterized protein n=1 Tax=Hyalomma asiaticum TaxID=266040 RepID=A0ACB7RUQ6_HYAAI|nr:hypothetical protein HPB50_017533 [Hyalomma asiaticum]
MSNGVVGSRVFSGTLRRIHRVRAPGSRRIAVSGYIPTLGNLVFVCLVPFLILIAAAALAFYMKGYTPVPGRAVWCVYELAAVATRDYSPTDMPSYLCSAFVYAYATLVRRGRLAPKESYQGAVKKLQSVAQDPSRDVYLALAGPDTPSGVASETASSTRYRTQLCGGLEDVLEDLDLQGAMFHWPSPYRDTLGGADVARQFFGVMETCLDAFSKKMALVVPRNEGERRNFFPFINDVRHSYNVVYWTHNLHDPGHDAVARCTVNLPDIVNLQMDLKKTTPALHDRAILTVSLRALQYQLLIATGPNKLSSVQPNKTEVLPYTAVSMSYHLNCSQIVAECR